MDFLLKLQGYGALRREYGDMPGHFTERCDICGVVLTRTGKYRDFATTALKHYHDEFIIFIKKRDLTSTALVNFLGMRN